MAKSLYPWCASNTMRQRVTTCWGVPCARTHVSSTFACPGFSLKITMQPVNYMEIDLSSYLSASTLAETNHVLFPVQTVIGLNVRAAPLMQ